MIKIKIYLLMVVVLTACSKIDVEIVSKPLKVEEAFPVQTENLIIITLDGFRWQEVFKGVDAYIIEHNEEAQASYSEILEHYMGDSALDTREKLLPFFWRSMGNKGQLFGNRDHGNYVNVKNPYWLSYPGYSEMFTGQINYHINSNQYGINPAYNI